ncbi:GlxA family transcriptional regulator [Phytoactinopolyspora limicola]|uniref:GlxA family transcriptional regulator n=1 Tax=Phytoactinopolyspora limicola TaxID=2715536 RepID=UPI00140E2A4B|nr:helix-turn-helix domain-containing protein [Phytoactinopolyspora limicola]
MRTVAVLALDDVVGFELSVPPQILGSAQTASGERLYDVRVCGDRPVMAGARGEPMFAVHPPYPMEEASRADTIIVPAVTGDGTEQPEVHELLRTAHARGARIASICGGAFVLAAAGLLDGRPATTHWAFADELAARYPQLRVDPAVLYVDDGQILTAAGLAAGIDLCFHLIRCDYGADVAARTARWVVTAPHRAGGQAQFIAYDASDPGSDPTMASVMEWMIENLHQPITLSDIAQQAYTSSRTLSRRFREQTGLSPLQWLLRQRIAQAQRLLETTNLPIEQIAIRAGFGSAPGMRRHFIRLAGTTPAAYRSTFNIRSIAE